MTTPNLICLSINAVLKMQNCCAFSVFARFSSAMEKHVLIFFFFHECDHSMYSYESEINLH